MPSSKNWQNKPKKPQVQTQLHRSQLKKQSIPNKQSQRSKIQKPKNQTQKKRNSQQNNQRDWLDKKGKRTEKSGFIDTKTKIQSSLSKSFANKINLSPNGKILGNETADGKIAGNKNADTKNIKIPVSKQKSNKQIQEINARIWKLIPSKVKMNKKTKKVLNNQIKKIDDQIVNPQSKAEKSQQNPINTAQSVKQTAKGVDHVSIRLEKQKGNKQKNAQESIKTIEKITLENIEKTSQDKNVNNYNKRKETNKQPSQQGGKYFSSTLQISKNQNKDKKLPRNSSKKIQKSIQDKCSLSCQNQILQIQKQMPEARQKDRIQEKRDLSFRQIKKQIQKQKNIENNYTLDNSVLNQINKQERQLINLEQYSPNKQELKTQHLPCQRQQIQIKYQIPQESSHNQGLPNVGNTCFINTLLQILYSIKPIREQIICMQNEYQQNLPFTTIIAKIFISIKQRLSYKEKNVLMKKFVQKLQKNNSFYSVNSQQDSLSFVMDILNIVRNENRYIDSFFDLTLKQTCKRNKSVTCRQQLSQASFVVKQKSLCRCGGQMKLSLQGEHQYLLIVAGNTQFQKQQRLQGKFGRIMIYQIVSYAVYYGTGRAGHYISERVNDQGKWIRISDSLVSQIKIENASQLKAPNNQYQKAYNGSFIPFAVYKFKKKLQFTTKNTISQNKKFPIKSQMQTVFKIKSNGQAIKDKHWIFFQMNPLAGVEGCLLNILNHHQFPYLKKNLTFPNCQESQVRQMLQEHILEEGRRSYEQKGKNYVIEINLAYQQTYHPPVDCKQL